MFQGRSLPDKSSEQKRIVTLLVEKHKGKPITRKQFNAAYESEFDKPKTPLHDLRKQETWIDTAKWSTPSIEERLFTIGCLGYIYENSNVYAWSGGSLEKFRLANKLFVSPLFT
jgi:hypothetical protein